jgi:Holliday junction DNA helicase RuvA
VIGRLTGRIVEEAPDGTLVVDVQGVGYEVAAPLGTAGRAAAHDPTGSVTLYVHTHVREDILALYGFLTRDDRATFRALLGVSNVGPKSALAILGSLSAAELAQVVASRSVNRLTAVPGVGKKTAERLVLELKDKLSPVAVTHAAQAAHRAPQRDGKGELLFGALTTMGFRPVEAERAIAALGTGVEARALDDLVRDALAVLAR